MHRAFAFALLNFFDMRAFRKEAKILSASERTMTMNDIILKWEQNKARISSATYVYDKRKL